ncbi:cysteine desulfurase [Evansella vedderi]|uniref:Cysteine desulfurase n=1 Tax=Evansella vedderi TaxID=38282 RepID=A0ABT9ZSG9_9BACI|nr:IscS subfamily cysteine desulfurase [Evansella vedderi]MDQ0254178.1 cysteine desulfurase [Evansella vedderi]
MIYLDHAATTPMSQNAVETFVKASTEFFANTNSLHEQGEKSKLLLNQCRKEIANLFHADSQEIFFTSGGSESNLRVLESLYLGNKYRGNHVITTTMEHPSVHSFFHKLENNGVNVTYVGVNNDGQVRLNELEEAIRPDTILASIQHVNSEIGTIQPMQEIGSLLKKHDVIFHSDCVQSFGKIPINVVEFQLDALSISSHKIYGPKGVGAVFLSKNVKWKPADLLTTHESGFRQGTLNTPGIAAFTTAALDMEKEQKANLEYMRELRQLLLEQLSPISHLIKVEGDIENQLPHIIGMGIHGLEGQYMLLTLDRHGICISTGSACQSEKLEPSIAMKALHRTSQEAKRFFRISMGIHNTREDILETATRIVNCVYEKEGKVIGE